jgi:hypothetical protein
MKPFLIAVSIAVLIVPTLNAQELQLTKPVLIAQVPTKVRQFDKTTKSRIEVDGFGYGFFVYLKNTSDKPLTVVTDSLSQQSAPGESKQNVTLDMNKMTLADGGALVIPAREDLRLVELRPGEAAALKIELKTSVPLEEIVVTYKPKDFYDGRFGYWTGKVVSEPLKIEAKEKDNTMP